MENLEQEEKRLVCDLLHTRYAKCVKSTLWNEVLRGEGDAVQRKCTALFADLQSLCNIDPRKGLQRSSS